MTVIYIWCIKLFHNVIHKYDGGICMTHLHTHINAICLFLLLFLLFVLHGDQLPSQAPISDSDCGAWHECIASAFRLARKTLHS